MTTSTDQQDREQADRIRIAEAFGLTNVQSAGNSWYAYKADGNTVRVPDWFHSADAALTICEFMHSRGCDAKIRMQNGVWNCEFTEPSREYSGGWHATARYAITKAFLAFLDAQNEAQKGPSAVDGLPDDQNERWVPPNATAGHSDNESKTREGEV